MSSDSFYIFTNDDEPETACQQQLPESNIENDYSSYTVINTVDNKNKQLFNRFNYSNSKVLFEFETLKNCIEGYNTFNSKLYLSYRKEKKSIKNASNQCTVACVPVASSKIDNKQYFSTQSDCSKNISTSPVTCSPATELNL